VGLEVPESGDDSMGLVDGVAAAAALTQNLPVFESGDHVLDAGCDPAALPVMVVGHGASGLVASRCGDGWDAEVAAVPEDPSAAVEQVRDGVAGGHDFVAVVGPSTGRARQPDGCRSR
jgi:hypothetical protein